MLSDGRTLVFCEVKTRRLGSGEPFDSLHGAKQSQVRRIAAALADRAVRPPVARGAALRRDRRARRPRGRARAARPRRERVLSRDRPRQHVRGRRRDEPPRLGRGRHPLQGPAGVHGRRARRQGRARGARARARGARRTRASCSRAGGSRSTSRPPTCARSARASTCRSRSRCSSPAASSRRTTSRAARSSASWRSTASCAPCAATLAIAEGARRHGLRRLLVPRGVAAEAALVPELEVLAAATLEEAVAFLRGEAEPPVPADLAPEPLVDAPRRWTSPTCAATTA